MTATQTQILDLREWVAGNKLGTWQLSGNQAVGYLLDIYGTPEFVMRTLVEKFAPKLVRSAA